MSAVNNSPNFESVIINYVIDNPTLSNKIDSDFFKDEHHQLFYKMLKFFYASYKIMPISIDSKDLSQFKEFCFRNLDKISIDKTITPEENLRRFLSHADNILQSDYRRYSPKFLIESIRGWIEWENATKGYKLAMEYRLTAQVNPTNVKDIISKCKQIVNNRSTILWDDEVSQSFFDSEAHKQTLVTDLVNSGYPLLNQWLSGDKNGGFEKGTVTMLVAESNIGKCCSPNTRIKVRNKKTGITMELTFEKFYGIVNSSSKIDFK